MLAAGLKSGAAKARFQESVVLLTNVPLLGGSSSAPFLSRARSDYVTIGRFLWGVDENCPVAPHDHQKYKLPNHQLVSKSVLVRGGGCVFLLSD